MKKTIAILLFALASTAFGSDRIALPAADMSSAESIAQCESQVTRLKGFEKFGDKTGTAYRQINPGSDSFLYLFTTPAEPAHPAMLKITLHPMADPRQPKEGEIEFFTSYAGNKTAFLAWSKKVVFDFGRGLATGVMKGN